MTFSSILSSRKSPKRDPSLIVSRFNKHRGVRDQFVAPEGEMFDGEQKLIELREGEFNFTIVTGTRIVGAWRGQEQSVRHSLGTLKYKIIDNDGEIIDTKDDLGEASGVLLNGSSKFWLPNHAVLPFCNLLNFIA